MSSDPIMQPAAETPASERMDTALKCLVAIAAHHHIAAKENELAVEFGSGDRVFTYETVRKAAGRLGLRTKYQSPEPDKLGKMALPAITLLKGVYVVVVRSDDSRVMIFDPLQGRPSVLPKEEFFSLWDGKLLVITKPFSFKDLGREFNLGWFVPVLMRYRRFFTEVIALAFLLQAIGLITPFFTQVIIDKVLPHHGTATLDILIGIIFVTYLFQSVMSYLRMYIFIHTTNKVDTILGTRLFRHVCALPLRYFELRRIGDVVTRVRELENIRNFLTGTSLTALLDTVFGVLFFFAMFYYNAKLTLVVILALPFFIGVSLYFTPKIREQLKVRFAAYMENYSFLVESLTGVHTVKALAVEPQFNKKWESTIAKYTKLSFSASNLNNVFTNLSQAISMVTNIGIIWYGSRLVMAGQMSVGQLIAFNMLSGQAINSATHLTSLWQSFQQARLSVAMLGDILNSPVEPQSGAGAAGQKALAGKVSFDNVSFRYRPDVPEVLKGVSLEIQAGERVGIVGRSGSGKSTLAKLVQRLYLPESGRVLVDDADIGQLDPVWLRRQIGVVLQENFLFSGSVRDNIAAANPGASMEEVIHAAQIAGAHEFICELPEGYDTNVGERGTSLSGGQKQRIAIARALMTNPRILIFDEATSQLDYLSERIIMDNLDKICAGRTVFIIAHRLSTVRRCDRLVIVDHGRIVEQGTHEALLARQGLYFSLYNQQVNA